MAQLASVLHLVRFSKVLGVRIKGAVDWIVGGKEFVRGFITYMDRETDKQADKLA